MLSHGKSQVKMDRDAAEAVAIDAVSFIAADEHRLLRFLDLAGLTLDGIRSAAASPGFLAAVLDHVAADESLLVDLARALEVPPERIMRARHLLSPPDGA
jgi:hypothetical protein